jgi:hypothetical protein
MRSQLVQPGQRDDILAMKYFGNKKLERRSQHNCLNLQTMATSGAAADH